MLRLVTVQIGKFVENVNEKRKVVHQPFGLIRCSHSSVKNMCIRFVTIRQIPKTECVCQKLQRSLRYLWVNSLQVFLRFSLMYKGHWSRMWVKDLTSILKLQ